MADGTIVHEVDMFSLCAALRPEAIKKQFKENNGKAVIRLSDHFKN